MVDTFLCATGKMWPIEDFLIEYSRYPRLDNVYYTVQFTVQFHPVHETRAY
jgi:hypothetical protein